MPHAPRKAIGPSLDAVMQIAVLEGLQQRPRIEDPLVLEPERPHRKVASVQPREALGKAGGAEQLYLGLRPYPQKKDAKIKNTRNQISSRDLHAKITTKQPKSINNETTQNT